MLTLSRLSRYLHTRVWHAITLFLVCFWSGVGLLIHALFFR